MSNNPQPPHDGVAGYVRHARWLYSELSEQLRNAIIALKRGDVTPESKRTVEDVIRSHQKALSQVIDLEAKLEKRDDIESGAGEFELSLDLDAARHEICRRCAALRERRDP